MRFLSLRLYARWAVSWFTVLVPLWLVASPSCQGRRLRSHSKSGQVERYSRAPSVATVDATVPADGRAGAGGLDQRGAGATVASSATAGSNSAQVGVGSAMAGAATTSSATGRSITMAGAASAASAVSATAGTASASPPTIVSAGASYTNADAGIEDAGANATIGNAAQVGDAAVAPPASVTPVERAILVSVDGLGGKYVELQLAKGKLPGFAALRRSSSSTLNARSDYDNNYTLPNHTTMLTGRPVNRDTDLPPDVHHGWTINGVVDTSTTLHSAGNPALTYVASVFDVVHDHGKKTCMFAGKLKFSIFSNSYNAINGAEDRIGVDNGRNKIDRVVLMEGDTEQLISTAEADLASGVCDFAFIHIADPDTIGHGTGWGSDAWYAALDRVDGWIGRLARFAGTNGPDPVYGFVLTADHGGGAGGHGDPEDIWDYQIPFFASGPRYTPNTDLYTIASSLRCDPGLVRPRYSALPQPIRNADAANVILGMLGLPPLPGSPMRSLLAPK